MHHNSLRFFLQLITLSFTPRICCFRCFSTDPATRHVCPSSLPGTVHLCFIASNSLREVFSPNFSTRAFRPESPTLDFSPRAFHLEFPPELRAFQQHPPPLRTHKTKTTWSKEQGPRAVVPGRWSTDHEPYCTMVADLDPFNMDRGT